MNPYADQLTFLDDKTRTRRDHEKYLGLIDVVALLHQYQREIKRETWEGDDCKDAGGRATQGAVAETLEYIEVTLEDIATANKLAHEVLGRSLDELPPQTRRLLQLITEMVSEECQRQNIKQSDYRFSRKAVRHKSGWTDFQVKKHMRRLEEMEYVLIHRGKRGQSYEYELLYQGEGESGNTFLMGLIDTNKLKAAPAHPCARGTSASCTSCDAKKEPLNRNKEPSSSPQVAAKLPRSSSDKNAENTTNKALNGVQHEISKKSTSGKNNVAPHHTAITEVML